MAILQMTNTPRQSPMQRMINLSLIVEAMADQLWQAQQVWEQVHDDRSLAQLPPAGREMYRKAAQNAILGLFGMCDGPARSRTMTWIKTSLDLASESAHTQNVAEEAARTALDEYPGQLQRVWREELAYAKVRP